MLTHFITKDFPGIDNSKNDFFAVARQRAYLDASPQYSHQALAGRPFGKDFAPGWVLSYPGVTDQRVYFAGAQLSEQEVLLEDLPFLAVGRGVHEGSLIGPRHKRLTPRLAREERS